MPVLQLEILKGRPIEKKREMIRRITDILVEILDCPRENVYFIIREMETENVGLGGTLVADRKK